MLRNLKKTVLGIALLAIAASSANAYTVTYHKDSRFDTRHDRSFIPYQEKHHVKKHAPQVVYYSTNNPNVTIVVQNPKHVLKRDIERALRNFIRSNDFYSRRW